MRETRVSLDLLVASEWGRLVGTREMARQPPALLDRLLAITANAHRLMMVTQNASGFLNFPLAVFNSWTFRSAKRDSSWLAGFSRPFSP